MLNRQPQMMYASMPARVPLIVPNAQLAAAYVPIQCYVNALPPQEALEKGTLFPELFSPYLKEDKMRGEECDGCR